MKQTGVVRHRNFISHLALSKRLAAFVAQPSWPWGRRASCPSIRRFAGTSPFGSELGACAKATSAPKRFSTGPNHLINLKSKSSRRALRTPHPRPLPSERGERMKVRGEPTLNEGWQRIYEIFCRARMQRFCAIILLTLLYSACHQRTKRDKLDNNASVEVMAPAHGAYTGAFIDFGEAEEDVTLEGIEDFETMVGKHQAIIASSSYWGEQDFPSRSLSVIWQHRSLPLVLAEHWPRPFQSQFNHCGRLGQIHR